MSELKDFCDKEGLSLETIDHRSWLGQLRNIAKGECDGLISISKTKTAIIFVEFLIYNASCYFYVTFPVIHITKILRDVLPQEW